MKINKLSIPWHSVLFLLKVFAVNVFVFVLFKPIFMINFHQWISDGNINSFNSIYQVCLHGLPMDIAMTCYLLLVPLLIIVLRGWIKWTDKGWRRVLDGYFVFTSILVSAALVVDRVMYGFWQFKLDETVLSYIATLDEAVDSVPASLVVKNVLAIVLLSTLLFILQHIAVRRFLKDGHTAVPDQAKRKMAYYVILLGLIVIGMRGGVGKEGMNIGRVYFSEVQKFNESAINPLYNFLSTTLTQKSLVYQYQFFSNEELDNVYAQLNMPDGKVDGSGLTVDMVSVNDSSQCSPVLATLRPNVVLVMVEGFAASFIEPLGGEPDVSPCFNALCKEGLLFTQCYANSFRTDRGTLSIMSGYPAFPEVSVMRWTDKARHLPSIAASLQRVGYHSSFLYGGDVTIFNMKEYLEAVHYDAIQDVNYFPENVQTGQTWGVQDHVVLDTLARQIIAKDAKQQSSTEKSPFFLTCLTLSSHENWQVPYSRLSNPQLNAIAYTDSCIGALVATLKASPAWNNLLLIFVADHGIPYPEGRNLNETNPLMSHIPMLWTGGALARIGKESCFCNQSDLAATLLSAMQIPVDDYRFGRDVLSASYRYPFAVHTAPGYIAYIDSTGATIYQIRANHVVTDIPAPSTERLQRAKAYLQKTMEDFAQLGKR